MAVQSDCQASRLGLCDESAVGLGRFWFQGAVIPGAVASYQHLTHSLSNFLCVAIKGRFSGLLKGLLGFQTKTTDLLCPLQDAKGTLEFDVTTNIKC